MAYLFCRYKEEKDYINAVFQIEHTDRDITSCRINKVDFIPSDKEYGLVRLVKMDAVWETGVAEIEIDDILRRRYRFYVPRDNVQMTVPVKR